jgi:opacity protein-like surface antigen
MHAASSIFEAASTVFFKGRINYLKLRIISFVRTTASPRPLISSDTTARKIRTSIHLPLYFALSPGDLAFPPATKTLVREVKSHPKNWTGRCVLKRSAVWHPTIAVQQISLPFRTIGIAPSRLHSQALDIPMRHFRPALLPLALVAACLTTVAAPARAEKSSMQPETGYNYGEVEDARYGALSGSLRAWGNGVTGVFSNPASIGAARVYHVGALAQVWPEARRQSYGAAAVDSVTNRLAAGIGFVWNDQDPSGIKRRSTDLRIALAYPFSDIISFGVSGRYLKLSQDGLGPLGKSRASGGLAGDPIVNSWSFDAGVNLRPTKNLALGVVGSNLSNPGTGYQPTSVGGGIGIGNSDMVFEIDAVADFTTWQRTTARAMAGFEYLAGDHVPLRIGYRYDDGAKAHAASAGLGYIDPQFSIDLSARRYVVGDKATAIMFTVQYFVESSGLTRTPQAEY